MRLAQNYKRWCNANFYFKRNFVWILVIARNWSEYLKWKFLCFDHLVGMKCVDMEVFCFNILVGMRYVDMKVLYFNILDGVRCADMKVLPFGILDGMRVCWCIISPTNSYFHIIPLQLLFWPVAIALTISGIKRAGHTLHSSKFFDTLKFLPKTGQQHIRDKAIAHQINLRYFQDGCVSNCHRICVVCFASLQQCWISGLNGCEVFCDWGRMCFNFFVNFTYTLCLGAL